MKYTTTKRVSKSREKEITNLNNYTGIKKIREKEISNRINIDKSKNNSFNKF